YEIFAAHLNDPPIPPQQRNPDIPPELTQVILKSLAKNPADRFQTAAEFREALQNVSGLLEDVSSTKTFSIPEKPPTSKGNLALAHVSDSRSTSTANLEMAYVLFMDIVAYSSLPMDQQSQRITQLVDIVRGTQEFRHAQENDQLI